MFPTRAPLVEGLIPAHAGKTAAAAAARTASAAHPRSRGENLIAGCLVAPGQGSSPLTRGKRVQGLTDLIPARLIPAHAGKTETLTLIAPHSPAHPRSRGENEICAPDKCPPYGSSPLTRGKLVSVVHMDEFFRLIPAHAGKTHLTAASLHGPGAHPRSRGENGSALGWGPLCSGSSPLTRGKRTHR